jgi:hypothetical protein
MTRPLFILVLLLCCGATPDINPASATRTVVQSPKGAQLVASAGKQMVKAAVPEAGAPMVVLPPVARTNLVRLSMPPTNSGGAKWLVDLQKSNDLVHWTNSGLYAGLAQSTASDMTVHTSSAKQMFWRLARHRYP